jgi:hypothetical protein
LYDEAMKCIWAAMVFSILGTTGPAFSQTPESTSSGVGFDCWIGTGEGPLLTPYIRCIADRDLPSAALPDPPSEAFLESLHQELHRGAGATVEKMYKTNIQLVRESRAVWHIRIHSYPTDSSWQENMPERLVRALLCPTEGKCTVFIRKP